ncbi:hypothetical protein FKM82_001730 [Ascaphus truei]
MYYDEAECILNLIPAVRGFQQHPLITLLSPHLPVIGLLQIGLLAYRLGCLRLWKWACVPQVCHHCNIPKDLDSRDKNLHRRGLSGGFWR